MKKKYFIIIIILLLTQYLNAQIKDIGILPSIKNYTPKEYNAAQQNWAAIQDNRGIMYFANTDGAILQFDGKSWTKIKIPNQAVFSFAKDEKGKIYVGAKTDLGYLQPDETGKLNFISLKNKIPITHKDFKKVWDIFITKDSTVCFQTYEELFLYKNDTIKVIPVEYAYEEGLFLRAYHINNKLFVYTKKKGLFRLETDGLKFVENSEIFAEDKIRGILPYKDDKLLIVTWEQGFLVYDNNTFKHINTKLDSIIYQNIYRATKFSDYFAFGLQNGGLIITDKELNPIQYITSDIGLQNDIITNFYFDNQNNLWLTLANGISCITPFTPFTKFNSYYGFENESKTLSSKLHNNILYIGTSTGVYYKEWYKDNFFWPTKFKNITNPEGNLKTYTIDIVDGEIICTSSVGIFSIVNNIAKFILVDRGIRTYKQLKSNPDIIIGAAAGLFLFNKTNDNWEFISRVGNFEKYSRYIEEDPNGFLWMSNSSKGIYKILLKDSFSIVQDYILYDTAYGLHGLPSHTGNFVFKIGEEVVFGTEKGIYKYDYEKDNFFPYEKLNHAIGENIPIVKIKQDLSGNIWFKQRRDLEDGLVSWELGVLLNKKDSFQLLKKPFYKYKNKIFSFNQIDEYTYIIGAEQGFVHYDSRIKVNYDKKYPAFVRNVKLSKNDSLLFGGVFLTADKYIGIEQLNEQIPILTYEFNDLRIYYSAAFYEDVDNLQFKVFLEGDDDDWSDWTQEIFKDYSNLSPGSYTFYIKAKNIYEVESTVATYQFVIKPPWYRTVWAYIIYIILAIVVIWAIIYLYTLRLRKQKIQLEILVKQRTVEIQQQKEEIEAQRDQLESSNEVIKKKNKDITSSIEYAKRIQTAMLPLDSEIIKHLSENFILFKPRDIVSGDFYWFEHKNNKTIISAIDCTGHGVPGAFMSMIGSEILTTIVSRGITDPGKILDMKNQYIRAALKQDTSENQDGMDMAICVIDKDKQIVEFAGAKNPLLYIVDDEIHRIKGDRQSIGGHQIRKTGNFKKYIIPIKSPMWFYIFSDGFQDQFGGEHKRKFMIKRMRKLLMEIHKKPMNEQKNILNKTIEDWMINSHQTDDIIVIGFKL